MKAKVNKYWTQSLALSSALLLTSVILGSMEARIDKITNQLLLISYLIFSTVASIKSKKLLKPDTFFIQALSIYTLISGINLSETSIFPIIDSQNEQLSILFILFFSLGMAIYSEPIALDANKKKSILIPLILSTCAPLSWAQLGNIPIFMGEDGRRDANPILYLGLIFGWLVTCAILYPRIKCTSSKIERANLTASALAYAILLLASGYRTPLFSGILVIAFYYTNQNNKKISIKTILTLLGSFALINMIFVFRIYSEYGAAGIDKYSERAGIKDSNYLEIALIYNFKESSSNFQTIRNNEKNTSPGLGQYFLENIATILPGHSQGYGATYNKLTYAETERTKTATIIAPGYIDFGTLGVALLGFTLGLAQSYLSLIAKNKPKLKSDIFFTSSILFSFYAIWIHTGIIFQPANYLILLMAITFIFLPNRLKPW